MLRERLKDLQQKGELEMRTAEELSKQQAQFANRERKAIRFPLTAAD